MSDSPIPSAVASKLETVAWRERISDRRWGYQDNGFRVYGPEYQQLVLRTDAESAIALAEKRARDAEKALYEAYCEGFDDANYNDDVVRVTVRETWPSSSTYAAIRSITSNTAKDSQS